MIPNFVDSIARLRNAYMRGLDDTKIIKSKMNLAFLKVLEREGFIRKFELSKSDKYAFDVLLRYHRSVPAIRYIKLFSRPGCRMYCKVNKLKKFYNGLGVYLLSTSCGIMTDKEARIKNLGGELLCGVF